MKIIFGIFLFVIGFAPSALHTEELVVLKVKITNVENADSNIMIAVFKSHDTFLTDDVYKREIIAVSGFTETEVKFHLSKGEYAVAAFQDRNKNGDLDRNVFMFPSEPYGFSNNFRPSFKPPHWSDVSFEVKSEKNIEIELN